MTKAVLGLDINEDFLAAVVVEQSGKEKRLVACGSIEYDESSSLAEMVGELLAQVGWQGGDSSCGFSISRLSLRNLTIPFTDRRKIDQVLPFELEDQLLTPVDEQVVEHIVTRTSDNASHLLVAGLEKDELRHYLDSLEENGLHPERMSPRIVCLAEQFLAGKPDAPDTLFLVAGLQSINMLLVHQGQVMFIRHLPYPDRMFSKAPFSFRSGMPSIDNHEEAMACVASLCDDIKKSIGYFGLESGVSFAPQTIVLAGCMVHVDDFYRKVQDEFGQQVLLYDVQQDSGIRLRKGARGEWNTAFHNHALAIALQGTRKKQLINFRKGEFAREKLFFASQPKLVAAAAVLVLLIGAGISYLGVDYRAKKATYDEMGGKMQAIFKETFPDRTRITDPLIEMQASIRNIQAPSISTPVFSGDKRVLNILADISDRVPPDIEIHVTRMVIDRDSVRLKGTTDTFNNVNIIQNQLRQSTLYDDVDIVSAAADKESSLIRFELRMDMGGGS